MKTEIIGYAALKERQRRKEGLNGRRREKERKHLSNSEFEHKYVYEIVYVRSTSTCSHVHTRACRAAGHVEQCA